MDAAVIRAELSRIIRSETLRQSARLIEFLRFTTEESLAGRGSDLKESLIAVRVYGRAPDYNPKSDSIVRTEAGRLREKLSEYYLSEGRANPLRITYPKGSYNPSFVSPTESEPDFGALAVLPFTNTSGNPEDEFFSDGLTDELIAALARIENLHVIARTSAFQFKGKSIDVRRIGRDLNVGLILEGSVRSHQRRIRVTAQLIQVATGFNLWSQTYEREVQDVFVVQEEITRAIADRLARQFSPGPRAIAAPVDEEAHRLYLKGRYCFYKWTVEEVNRSFTWLRQAVARDPNYAAAWTAIADSHCILAYWGVSPALNVAAANEALGKALSLNPEDQQTQTIHAAYLAAFEWRWKVAESRFRPLLDAGYAPAFMMWVISTLTPTGRLAEAADWMRRVLELDPLNLGAHVHLGRVLYMDGRFDEGRVQLESTLRIEPSFREAHWQLALAYEAAGDLERAMASFGRALALSGDVPGTWGSIGHCLAKSGQQIEAARYRQKLEGLDDEAEALPGLALLHVAFGEYGKAIDCIERSIVLRSPLVLRLRVDPRFAPLRGEERFRNTLAGIGLTPS